MTDQIVIRDLQPNIDADMVLRGQGAEPVVIRARQPRLIEIAERAVQAGAALIEPAAVYRFAPVETVKHERLILTDGTPLTGALIAQHLAPARYVALIVCTVGAAIDDRISALMPRDPAYALALDGYGSAAAEALGTELCVRLEKDATRIGHCTSVPISPGMVGWPVEVGQPQIFSNLAADAIGVTLNDSAQMIPRKSTSLVLGFAPTPFEAGTPCDFCALRNACRYHHHA
jgi:cobalamin-dependent methionine synthase I